MWAEVRGTTHHVQAEQLDGAAYEQAWAQITTASPSFLDYLAKTDRRIPVLRLTPTNPGRPDEVPDKAHFAARADFQRTDVETAE